MSQTAQTQVDPGVAIRRLAAAISLHASKSSQMKSNAGATPVSAKPAHANPAKTAGSLARLPIS